MNSTSPISSSRPTTRTGTSNRARTATRTGALTVEVALCLPLLITVLFACYELAHANMLLHATESAAYEGCRVGIIAGATPEKIENAASGVLNSVGINNFTLTVTPQELTPQTETVEVVIEVPFRGNSAIPTLFIENPMFRGQCELSRERP